MWSPCQRRRVALDHGFDPTAIFCKPQINHVNVGSSLWGPHHCPKTIGDSHRRALRVGTKNQGTGTPNSETLQTGKRKTVQENHRKPCFERQKKGYGWYWLVVSTPLKNMKVRWDDDIPNWMKSHKIHVQSPQPGYVLKIFKGSS